MSEFDTNLDIETVKTLKETDKKCPDCGGVMDFNPATGGLSCPYCGHTEEIRAGEEEPKAAAELDFTSAEKLENCDWGASKKTVICKACGAESIYDSLQISAVCPFCGSNQVMEAADQNTMAPGGVVPFQITDQKAADLFKDWIKKKWFCPKMAKESAKAKHFKGVYLPFWTFDTKTTSQYKGEYGKDKTKTGINGEEKTVTTWHPTAGSYEESIDDELVAASTSQNQEMLQGVEPFHTEENKIYKPEYVAGFVAERYAVGIKDAWQMAKEKIKSKLKNTIESKIRDENNAQHVRNLQITTIYQDVTYKYLLLPIWLSSYTYKDKVYQFMVNGQTGRVSGKTPISAIKVAITIVAAVIVVAILYNMMS